MKLTVGSLLGALLTFSQLTFAAPGVEYRAWQFHVLKPEYVSESMKLALRYDIRRAPRLGPVLPARAPDRRFPGTPANHRIRRFFGVHREESHPVHQPEYKELERRLLHPDPQLLEQILAEKDRAIARAGNLWCTLR